MDITKSTRHQRIIGDYGEMLICNSLSRSGFEVTVVDHTGIDIVAYNPKTKDRFGITVKSRTRNVGTEASSVNILSNRQKNRDREKIKDACKAFACEPWIGVYVETGDCADLYLTSLTNYDRRYGNPGKVVDDWKMNDKSKEAYAQDTNVKHIHISFDAKNWW